MLIRNFVALALLLLPTALGAQPRYKPYKSAEVMLEYPDNWVQHTNIGTMLILVSTKGGETAVALERAKLNQPLEPSEMTETFATIQAEVIKDQYPDATGLTAVIVTHPTLGPVVQADFTMPGSDPRRPDRLRQYVLPRGPFLYKIVCRARATDFAKQEAAFNTILKSLRINLPTLKENA